jgi:tetratricopeptide (TPR) repeat protein
VTSPMSIRAILTFAAVLILGGVGLYWMLTSGKGQFVFVPDEAVRHHDHGVSFVTRARGTADKSQKAEFYSQAIEQFKKAVQIKPDWEVPHRMLGLCYSELGGQWELALRHLNQAIELRNDYPVAYYDRAKIYHRLSPSKPELLEKAIADYQFALKSERSISIEGDIRKALADAYNQKGEITKAIEQLKIYLSKAPHATDVSLVDRQIRGLELMLQSAAPSSSR